MKCSSCNWTNPPSHASCFSCGAPLIAAQAAGEVEDAEVRREGDDLRSPRLFAGFGARFAATLIDLLVMLVPAGLVIAAGIALGSEASRLTAIGAAALVAVFFLLLPALLDSVGGGSPGKRLLGIRVANAAGGEPTVLQAVLRHVLKYGAHLVLPFVLRLLESLLFPNHMLHNLAARTYVVRRDASAMELRRVLAADTRGRTFALMLGGLFGLLATLLIGLVAWWVIHSIVAAPNPRRDAVRATVKAMKPVLLAAEFTYGASGRFPAGGAELGGRPPGVLELRTDPEHRTVTAVLDSPGLTGTRLVFYPEFKLKGGRAELRKWHCGSPDLAPDDQPYNCRAAVAALVR